MFAVYYILLLFGGNVMKLPHIGSRLNELGLGTREQTSLTERWARERAERERAERERAERERVKSSNSGFEVFFLGERVKQNYGFVVAFLDSLVLDDSISARAMGLLIHILRNLDQSTLEIRVNPKDVMRELGITRDAYNRWIREFLKRGVIEKINAYTYKLKPNNLKDVVS